MTCPYCAETVMEEALVCPHCGQYLALVRELQKRIADLEERMRLLPPGNASPDEQGQKQRSLPVWALALFYLAFAISQIPSAPWSFSLSFKIRGDSALLKVLIQVATFCLLFGPSLLFGMLIGLFTKKTRILLDIGVGLAAAIVTICGFGEWRLSEIKSQMQLGWLIFVFGIPALFLASILVGKAARERIHMRRLVRRHTPVTVLDRRTRFEGFATLMTGLSPILIFIAGIVTPLLSAVLLSLLKKPGN
jgi:hypothetical protein